MNAIVGGRTPREREIPRHGWMDSVNSALNKGRPSGKCVSEKRINGGKLVRSHLG